MKIIGVFLLVLGGVALFAIGIVFFKKKKSFSIAVTNASEIGGSRTRKRNAEKKPPSIPVYLSCGVVLFAIVLLGLVLIRVPGETDAWGNALLPAVSPSSRIAQTPSNKTPTPSVSPSILLASTPTPTAQPLESFPFSFQVAVDTINERIDEDFAHVRYHEYAEFSVQWIPIGLNSMFLHYTDKNTGKTLGIAFVENEHKTTSVKRTVAEKFRALAKKCGINDGDGLYEVVATKSKDKTVETTTLFIDNVYVVIKPFGEREGFGCFLLANDRLLSMSPLLPIDIPKPDDIFSDENRAELIRDLIEKYNFFEIQKVVDNYLAEIEPPETDMAYLLKNHITDDVLQATRACKFSYDTFAEEMFVYYKGVEAISRDVNFLPYIKDTYIELRTGFRKSKWLFFTDCTIKADDYTKSIFGKSWDMERNVIAGSTIEEYIDWGSFFYGDEILQANNVVMRFENSDNKEHYDHEITEKERSALKALCTITECRDNLINVYYGWMKNPSG